MLKALESKQGEINDEEVQDLLEHSIAYFSVATDVLGVKKPSGLQPSEQDPNVDTPPLRDGAEIIRAFSPFGQWLMVMRGTRRIMYPANNH